MSAARAGQTHTERTLPTLTHVPVQSTPDCPEKNKPSCTISTGTHSHAYTFGTRCQHSQIVRAVKSVYTLYHFDRISHRAPILQKNTLRVSCPTYYASMRSLARGFCVVLRVCECRRVCCLVVVIIWFVAGTTSSIVIAIINTSLRRPLK